MGGLSRKSRNIQLKMKRERASKLRQLKRLYKKASAAERALLHDKAHRVAPYLGTGEAYLKDQL